MPNPDSCVSKLPVYIIHSLLLAVVFFPGMVKAQLLIPSDSIEVDTLRYTYIQVPRPVRSLITAYDLGDLYNDVFHAKSIKKKSGEKASPIVLLPNIAANPTLGVQVGVKAVAGMKIGRNPATFMSVAATSASVSTTGIAIFYISHNVFTDANKWNLQGTIILSRAVNPDFGLGIGKAVDGSREDSILANANRYERAIIAKYFNFTEKVFREVRPGLFIGAGVSFNVRGNIHNQDSAETETPYAIYTDRKGFSQDHYAANGLLLDVKYTTRDNQNRAYSGMYFNAGFRLNQTWMGSSQHALQFNTDVRKYFSLSRKTPGHVIAIWNWGGYVVNGALPYLELPGTGKDINVRSGRGYKLGYFKSTQFNYSEVEYRFPIMKNEFVSGVAFFNLQTANDESGTKLFQVWRPGFGGGLRILMNKATRTNLCLDYAFGQFGSRGFFLGLNEAF